MGRLDIFSDLIRWAFNQLGITPRPWMGVVGLVLIMGLLLPSISRNARTSRARKQVSRLHELPADAREPAMDHILSMVRGNPEALANLAELASRSGQGARADKAFRELRATRGARTRDLERLSELLHGPQPRHPVEEAAAIERLIEAMAWPRAEERCARALARFPTDPSLLALQARIRQGSQGPEGPRDPQPQG